MSSNVSEQRTTARVRFMFPVCAILVLLLAWLCGRNVYEIHAAKNRSKQTVLLLVWKGKELNERERALRGELIEAEFHLSIDADRLAASGTEEARDAYDGRVATREAIVTSLEDLGKKQAELIGKLVDAGAEQARLDELGWMGWVFGLPSSLSDFWARFFRRSVVSSRHGYQICERRSEHAHAAAAGPA